jgi:hypothetical protein
VICGVGSVFAAPLPAPPRVPSCERPARGSAGRGFSHTKCASHRAVPSTVKAGLALVMRTTCASSDQTGLHAYTDLHSCRWFHGIHRPDGFRLHSRARLMPTYARAFKRSCLLRWVARYSLWYVVIGTKIEGGLPGATAQNKPFSCPVSWTIERDSARLRGMETREPRRPRVTSSIRTATLG